MIKTSYFCDLCGAAMPERQHNVWIQDSLKLKIASRAARSVSVLLRVNIGELDTLVPCSQCKREIKKQIAKLWTRLS